MAFGAAGAEQECHRLQSFDMIANDLENADERNDNYHSGYAPHHSAYNNAQKNKKWIYGNISSNNIWREQVIFYEINDQVKNNYRQSHLH